MLSLYCPKELDTVCTRPNWLPAYWRNFMVFGLRRYLTMDPVCVLAGSGNIHLRLAPSRRDPWCMVSRAPPPMPPSLDTASLSGGARSKARNWVMSYKGRVKHALYVVFA